MTSQDGLPLDDFLAFPDPSALDSQETPGFRFPVVGIGASAGGLDAFTQLLSHLPTDTGMAFVLIQHLDPSQKSLLTELLSRTTPLPVSEAEEGMAIVPNHIYVIPPNAEMTIATGRLHLTPFEKERKIHKTVDAFFISLAEERGAQTIGIVLSGGADDGTQGLEAIKGAGGITFAQSEDSAQVKSMPNTAVATGQVDFVLPPAEIASELIKISRHPYIKSASKELPEPPEISKYLNTIFRLIRSSFGVDFSGYKHTTIQRRILRRMALYRLDQLTDYINYIQENPLEIQALYEEILIHVTHFFRDHESFETLKREVFPILVGERPPDHPIRIWVAGCSTGEEAYSIAIALLEFLSHHPRQFAIQIFATDVSALAIEKARSGVYFLHELSHVSPDRLQRFFVPFEGGYQISKYIRELCVFARQNLISDPPFSRMDLISCRNVLIYFGAALQRRIMPLFHYGLKPTGFLMLGSSERVGDFTHLFHLIDRKEKIYFKRLSSLSLPLDLGHTEILQDSVAMPELTPAQDPPQVLPESIEQILLSRYAPPGVVINAQLEILEFRGHTGSYLEPVPGQASLQLFSMVRDELRLELRAAIYQVKQECKPVSKEGLQLKESSGIRRIRIDVIPVESGIENEKYFLILFVEQTNSPNEKPKQDSPSRRSSSRKKLSPEHSEINRLNQELETTKAYLRSIIEEQQSTNQDLRAANEEILSSNEELQSTNEELQTAKEEIQATNEELSTINDELYRRNTETMQVSNDFQNLLGNINIPILMLEADLRIRRFTPTAVALFNVIPSDIGRPLSDIKHNLDFINLEAKILEVIDTLTLYSQEVQDREGHWYDLRIRPYRTLDNRIDGAVIVLVEIDTLKRSGDLLRQANDFAEAIIGTIRESLVVLDADLKVVKANARFYEIFQTSPAETEECLIFDLGNGQWNIPQLRLLLEELLPKNTQITNYLIEHTFEPMGLKNLRLNGKRLLTHTNDQLILLAIEDISTP